MIRYSIEPRKCILVKGYGFLLFAKIMGKSICKGVGKSLSCKYSQNMNHAKQYATDAFKATSKKVIQQTLEATDDLIGNKIADKITITVL